MTTLAQGHDSDVWIVRQRISIPFLYSTGPALHRFFEGLREGVLYAGRCTGCGFRRVPPQSSCGRCWRPVEELLPLSGRGRLVSFTRLPHAVAELPDVPPPVTYGLLALDGADTHLVHLVEAPAGVALRLGTPVEAVWRPERKGSILDIAHFRVLE